MGHMGKHIDKATKEQILLDIKNGMKVSEAGVKYSVTPTTIYGWMKVQADNTGTSALEIAKLRKENQELKEIIGWFALDKKRAEKNGRGSSSYGGN
jgi:transposase-like protein